MVRVLLILLGGQAMASMDASILVVAAPSFRADLHASGAQLQLIVAMYTIAFAAMVVTGARLGDVLGRRRMFLIGLAGFTAASLAGGLAPTPAALIVARALQGLAGAVMTPQVLSIIRAQFDGELQARAIGAYSMVLAVGVAAGQIVGGLLVGAHLLAAAWRPALLVNVPVGTVLLLAARRRLPSVARGPRRGLDLLGGALISVALLALVVPLTFGRSAGWPVWVWPCVGCCVLVLGLFVAVERRVAAGGGDPVLQLDVLQSPSVAPGVATVVLVMACYAGFLLSVTLHLQGGLAFSPVHAGAIFAIYASGFATASLSWPRVRSSSFRERLPVLGPPAMGSALLGIGLLAVGGGWPLSAIGPLLFVAGAGHACAFSPLAGRLTAAVTTDRAADVSGLVITASLVGQVLGVAAFGGLYLARAPHGSDHALEATCLALAVVLWAGTGCALLAVRGPRRVAAARVAA